MDDPRFDDPQFDPFDPALTADPYPIYAAMRERHPVYRSAAGYWVLFRHEDCAAVMLDRRFGHGSQSRKDLGSWSDGLDAVSARTDRYPVFFAAMDPPDHTRIRRAAAQWFTPRAMDQLAPRIQELADGLVATALEKGESDLLAEVGVPLSLGVLGEILGIPMSDRDQFQVWVSHFIRGLDPSWTKTERESEQRLRAQEEMAAYFRELVAHRRSRPGTDLVSVLAAGDADLKPDEVYGTCVLLLVTGFESTTQLVGNGMHALLRHPDQLARLRANPGLIGSAVEELLRFAPPAAYTIRTALDDVEFAGQHIAERERLLVLILAANRDPAVFADPDTLDIGRDPNPHLAFGGGIHHCLGAPLTRIEGRIVLGSLLANAPRIELTTDALVPCQNILKRGFERVPVSLRA